MPQEFSGSSPKRRRAEEKDEGIGSPDTLEEEKVEEVRREMLELRQQLDRERSARIQLEEQVRQTQESVLVKIDFFSPASKFLSAVIRLLTITIFVILTLNPLSAACQWKCC